jgi:arylsulfatase A
MHHVLTHEKRMLQLLGLFLCLALAATAHAQKRPNVVILLADDLGYRDIGSDGGPVKTPALDALALKGIRFTDFYSGASVCSPSRAVLLTGRNNVRAGVYNWINDQTQNARLLRREVTLAEVLKAQGYATAHLGKWHLGLPVQGRDKPTPADHGFDYWFATGNNAYPSHRNPSNFIRNGKAVGTIEGYACQIVVDEAIAWLDQKRDPERPFFLNVWFHEPHVPIAAPKEIVSAYGQLDDPGAIYSGTIDNTDRAIARLLQKLARVDAPENTLIIYSSDNGSYRADRVGNLRGTKGSHHDGGIRVPGIVSWPGQIPEGRVVSEPAGLVDVLPTVCGLLGIDKPAGVHLDGSDLTPVLRDSGTFSRHQPLFWLRGGMADASLRDGRFSLVAERPARYPKPREEMAAILKQVEDLLREKGTLEGETRGSTLREQMFEGFKDDEANQLRSQYLKLNMYQESWIPAFKSARIERCQLYDLSADPGQKKDVSAQYPEVVARLKKKLIEINASVMADGPDWSAQP